MHYIELGAPPREMISECEIGVRVPQLLIIARLREGSPMTAVEVVFGYGMPPGEREMSALGQLNDVYGIRRVQFNEPGRTVRVEYDATRLNEATVENLLRKAGLDVRDRLALT